MKVFTLLVASWLCTAASAAVSQYYVKVHFNTTEEMHAIVDRGFDVGGVNLRTKTLTLIMKEDQIAKTHGLSIVSKTQIFGPDQRYKKYADVVTQLNTIAQTYPQLAQVESIGKTLENRDIYAIKLTASLHQPANGLRKPTVLFDAEHHAREVMTPEVAMDIADYLTKNYQTDPQVQKWMNELEIWVVPMVNPDGSNKVFTSEAMWRKNTREGYGVDINRNYPYDWGTCQGSSGSKSSDTYRGPSAASEPETKALMDLATRIKPAYNISYHSYSELVIYPYGCSPKVLQGSDAQDYIQTGKQLAKLLKSDDGSSTYSAGTSYELLYNVDGGSLDWMYDDLKTKSYVIEMNSDSAGFQPNFDKWRDKTVLIQREGWKFLLGKALGGH